METQIELDNLLEKAQWAEKYSVEKSDILIQALRLAELLQNTKQIDEIRNEYIECLNFQGRKEEAFPHFSLLVSRLDNQEHPVSTFDKIEILWKYKWFMGSLPNFPNIPKTQIFEIMGDMERRYLEFGAMTQPTVYYYKESMYSALGDVENAAIFQKKYDECDHFYFPLLTLSDCEACVQDSKVSGALMDGNWAGTVEFAQPIISGEKKCETVPKRTFFKVALAFAKLGHLEEAAQYFEKGVQMLKDERIELSEHRRGICYLVLTHQWERALQIFEKHFQETIGILDKSEVFHFYHASIVLFRYLLRQQEYVTFQILENPVLYQSDGRYKISEVIQVLERVVTEIGEQFDKRNENNYYSTVLGEYYQHFLPV